jgi:hypothetical protein
VWSSPIAVFFATAAVLGLLSIAIAAVPFGGRVARHRWWRAKQLAFFVDTHRFDIALFGVMMLLVAAVAVVVALPAAGG